MFNNETITITDSIKIRSLTVENLKAIVSKRTGLPVSTYRLVSPKGKELLNMHEVEEYDIKIGDTIRVETWDGINDFLNLCVMGFSSHALGELENLQENIQRYLVRVAQFMAAHFGHIDLATLTVKRGAKPDEPVGEHPFRSWNRGAEHVDNMKCPIHEAAECGHESIVRLFIHYEPCCALAVDGRGLRPLNYALRNKKKDCARILLGKQGSRFQYGNKTFSLQILYRMKKWADQAKEKYLLMNGPEKSTLKNKKPLLNFPRVGQEVFVKGFATGGMNSKAREQITGEKFPLNDVLKSGINASPMNDSESDRSSKQSIILEEYFRKLSRAHNRENLVSGGIRMPKPPLIKHCQDGTVWVVPMPENMTAPSKKISYAPENRDFATILEEEEEYSTFLNTENESPNSIESRQRKGPSISDSQACLTPENEAVLEMGPLADTSGSSIDETRPQTENSSGGSLTNSVLPQISGSISVSAFSRTESRKTSTSKNIKTGRNSKSETTDSKRIRSAVLLARRNQTKDCSLSLPLTSNRDIPRPFYYIPKLSPDADFIKNSLYAYDNLAGIDRRTFSLQSISIASKFKHQPWLKRVQGALYLTRKQVPKMLSKGIDSATARSAQRENEQEKGSLKKTYTVPFIKLSKRPENSLRGTKTM